MLVEKPCCCETRTCYAVDHNGAHWRGVAVIAGAWQLYKTVRTYVAFAGDKTPTAHTAQFRSHKIQNNMPDIMQNSAKHTQI